MRAEVQNILELIFSHLKWGKNDENDRGEGRMQAGASKMWDSAPHPNETQSSMGFLGTTSHLSSAPIQYIVSTG